ncbi:integrator complex subunit 13 [Daktulosphaira vitifoliae]|uniref:integrator complex subunit 13 n=1 Tax=Daktulosphaira vitifoliae TaxID=58002 RepID=UPI0021A9B570|nr:integrator complex subunit 13 [Daktulosphaira vitifoliae]
MSLFDKLFPATHKTTFIVDHTPYFGLASNAHIKMDFTKRPLGAIPPSPVFKSMWTCSIESVLEYCRIVWDLFPEGKLIRVISSDLQARNLNTWALNQQNVNYMLHHLSALGPPAKLIPNPSRDYSIVYGFRLAAEAMSECTTAQKEHISKKATIEVQNKCRTIIITSARDNASIDNLASMFHNEMIKINKYTTTPDTLPIHHCTLVIINTYPDSISCEVTDRNLYIISPILNLEVYCIPASKVGHKIAYLLLKHYNLASTTVTGIPMKEEQNASSSANYDVEIYHEAAAHTAILNANLADAKAVVARKEEADYETIKLKWCTPRANNNLPDIHSCTTLHRITPVDINSRPSACLITFLLNGRSVLLEMIKQSGNKSMSHVLKSYNGEIYIHTVSSGRTVLEDPPSISEGPGGKVTQYRVADFGVFMRSNLLQPSKRKLPDDKNLIEDAKEKLKKQTAYWPLTTSSTIIFNLKQYTEPMLTLMVKENINDQEVMHCKQCIYALMTAESKNEHLITPSLTNPRKVMKKDDQYKSMWSELELFLKSNLYSENHCKILQCLLECRCKPDEDKIIEKTLLRFKKTLSERPSVIRATTDSPMSPPLAQQTGLKHIVHSNISANPNSVMYLQIIQEHNSHKISTPNRPQFAGRLKSVQMRNGNLFTKLYQHLDDDGESKGVK